MSEFTKIERASLMAIRAHGDQRYGDQHYEYHLQAVVDVLISFGITDIDMICAGWFHDSIEDTSMTYDDIEAAFGASVADLVWAVTGVGANRKERNRSIYEKIKNFPMAAVLKTADRIANAENARANSPSLFKMYCRERDAFVEAVKDHLHPLWLERLVNALTEEQNA